METITSRPYPDLLEWRTAHGYSQREAAKILGLSQAYYSKLERRAQATTGKRARRIMELTGVSLEVLVGATR